MILRNWWGVLGFRGVLALATFVILTYFGILGWISDGWTTGVSIIVGAISAAAAIFAYRQAVILDAVLGAVAFVLTIIGLFQYLNDSQQHTKESFAAYNKGYEACARGDAKGCEEGMKLFMCKYMESSQDLMRAATSAHININVPKEISGVVDMNAQHDINAMPPDCQQNK